MRWRERLREFTSDGGMRIGLSLGPSFRRGREMIFGDVLRLFWWERAVVAEFKGSYSATYDLLTITVGVCEV